MIRFAGCEPYTLSLIPCAEWVTVTMTTIAIGAVTSLHANDVIIRSPGLGVVTITANLTAAAGGTGVVAEMLMAETHTDEGTDTIHPAIGQTCHHL